MMREIEPIFAVRGMDGSGRGRTVHGLGMDGMRAEKEGESKGAFGRTVSEDLDECMTYLLGI